MLSSPDDIKQALSSFELVVSSNLTADGAQRLQTPFRYSDGALIDLFLYPPNNLLKAFRVTDLGLTASALVNLDFNILSTKRRKAHVEEICNPLDVLQQNGEFYIDMPSLDQLPDAIARLAQACIRVSDMVLNLRIKPLILFKDDLEELFYDHYLEYESPVLLTGAYGNKVNIDFKVTGKTGPVLIEAISTRSPHSSHVIATEAFVKWSDLSEGSNSKNFVTIYDTTANVFKEEDLKRLEGVSRLIPHPEGMPELLQTLCA